jgi:ferredoxin
MQIRVDQLRCDTTGICVKACPQIFRFQEGSKKAKTLVDEIPTALEAICLDLATRCPNKAIIIEESPHK